jgi:hypothetical protein
MKFIEDVKHPVLDADYVPDFIKLVETYDVRHQPQDKENPMEPMMLTLLPNELNRVLTLYLPN